MDLYLTPEGFRARGYGAEDLEDADLRPILNRAARAVDGYCSVPLLPQRHSFRGGTITDEQHDYSVGDGVFQGVQRTIWLRHTPVRTVTQARIYVTNTQYVSFDPADLFVSENSYEIVSLALTSNGLFGAAITPVLGLGVPKIRTSYTYGRRYQVVDEIVEATDARTYRALNQFWTDEDVTVKVDGVEQVLTTDYTVDREEGTVTFVEALAADQVVTVSYEHSMPSEIGDATGLIAVSMLGKRAITAGGMTGLRSLKVGEITIERDVPRNSVANRSVVDIPDEAARLLDGFSFISQ